MMQKLEKFLMPVANALSKNKVLSAIRDGFLITVSSEASNLIVSAAIS